METKNLFNVISTTVIIVVSGIFGGMYYLKYINIQLLIGLIGLTILFASSIKIADQWEKAVLLRMGKYIGLKGPGIFFIVPILDKVFDYVDQRVRVTDFKADQTLTKDTVPVNVVAVLYWTVWDVEKAALEVADYMKAVEYIAQTGLRDIIGRHELADLLQDRVKIAEDLQKLLDENTNSWGITCQTVGIKDITIPQGLSDAMSKQAQAERERKARVILGTAETEIAEKFAKASESYMSNPVALQLRAMNLIGEGLKIGSMIIVPSSALDAMNLGGISGIASLSQLNKTEQKSL
ncbi:MAG TPA: slipin family protein [Prolixibacteraceae bacterium]|jgi:regulator of protease activity HflC (stomatin/prohibitin superfamily)